MPRVPKVAAGITVGALLLGLGLLVFQLQRIKEIGEIEITKTVDAIVERDDGSCGWRLEFELENNTDLPLLLQHARAAITRPSPVSGRIIEDETGFGNDILNPNTTTTATLSFQLDSCPPNSDDITHDLFRVIYRSREFGNRIETARF